MSMCFDDILLAQSHVLAISMLLLEPGDQVSCARNQDLTE